MDDVKALIERGKEAIRQGRTFTHEEANCRLARWLDEGLEHLHRGEGIEISIRDELSELARGKRNEDL
jgi:hypothetical protein